MVKSTSLSNIRQFTGYFSGFVNENFNVPVVSGNTILCVW